MTEQLESYQQRQDQYAAAAALVDTEPEREDERPLLVCKSCGKRRGRAMNICEECFRDL